MYTYASLAKPTPFFAKGGRSLLPNGEDHFCRTGIKGGQAFIGTFIGKTGN